MNGTGRVKVLDLGLNVSNEDIGTDIFVTKLYDEIEIYQRLNVISEAFTPPLIEKIPDLTNYAKKLYCNAEVYTVGDGNFLGFIAFYANDSNSKIAYITLISVLPYAQKRGLGKTLLNLCIDISKVKGMSSLKIEVNKDNEKALHFYNKYGFEFCGEASTKSIYEIKKL